MDTERHGFFGSHQVQERLTTAWKRCGMLEESRLDSERIFADTLGGGTIDYGDLSAGPNLEKENRANPFRNPI